MKNMRSGQKSQGFTLIELMIVVAIIGILASIAVPAYQDYIVRAKVSEGMISASAIKVGVSEVFADDGQNGVTTYSAYIDLPATQLEISTDKIGSIAVGDPTGIITVTMLMPQLGGGTDTLVFAPLIQGLAISDANNSGTISWDCTGSTIDDKFLPAACK